MRKECAGWSMENLIWTQRPDRSGANEVGFPDGHGDWDGGKMREFAPIISTGTTHGDTHAHIRARSAPMEGISKRKYMKLFELDIDFACSYVHGQR